MFSTGKCENREKKEEHNNNVKERAANTPTTHRKCGPERKGNFRVFELKTDDSEQQHRHRIINTVAVGHNEFRIKREQPTANINKNTTEARTAHAHTLKNEGRFNCLKSVCVYKYAALVSLTTDIVPFRASSLSCVHTHSGYL